MQQTISQPFVLQGVGIHTGVIGRVRIHPAETETGRRFRIGATEIPAHVHYVIDTTRSTTLGNAGAKVSTVEHLLSALAGCGVDNAIIEVEGPEIPILDGSALPFVEAILDAGIEAQGVSPHFYRLKQAIQVGSGDATLRAAPSDRLRIDVTTEFDDWPDGKVTMSVEGAEGVVNGYADKIAPARTFAFRREVEMLLAAGLAKGGSLDNALVITPPDTFSAPLRVPAEWCAHKMLDVIGDLALLNMRLAMHVSARRPGHRMNTALAQALIAHSIEQTVEERS